MSDFPYRLELRTVKTSFVSDLIFCYSVYIHSRSVAVLLPQISSAVSPRTLISIRPSLAASSLLRCSIWQRCAAFPASYPYHLPPLTPMATRMATAAALTPMATLETTTSTTSSKPTSTPPSNQSDIAVLMAPAIGSATTVE